ncbi:MAG TPA: hypothetical protein VKE42_08375, partial [Candidatus Cybelea sp.]|nr:hypothetical protein [Candidatus Cybelea sp.]
MRHLLQRTGKAFDEAGVEIGTDALHGIVARQRKGSLEHLVAQTVACSREGAVELALRVGQRALPGLLSFIEQKVTLVFGSSARALLDQLPIVPGSLDLTAECFQGAFDFVA